VCWLEFRKVEIETYILYILNIPRENSAKIGICVCVSVLSDLNSHMQKYTLSPLVSILNTTPRYDEVLELRLSVSLSSLLITSL